MAGEEVFCCKVDRKAVPRADDLAIITAEDAVTHRGAILFWNGAKMFDGEIRDTFTRIDLKRRYDGIGGAGFDTAGTLAAMVGDRLAEDIDPF